ncbi:probable acyl-CoA dehydrogenase IBR3 isoform X2 [Cynara cardunculus var. scolymus]|uniref:probable acyl-CoA dehydrogenase IBR3 isoform X2 n=1 Tax=Cynara cardunculus var. scolymus TaxID=59895 RepID=UPI000D6239C4|nr:probable acyl-CoA dehydrogenase IBR3 isoform X2 [Cynara cardunculus var. scolymus]
MARYTGELVGKVNSAHQFDNEALFRYCSIHVEGFPRSSSKFSVSQFGYGQSNPTYLIEMQSGTVVKRVFCLCTDSSVIGTPFYVMEFLEGRIFLDPMLPGVAPNRRQALYHATAKALASLHSADVDAIGLGGYGRRNNYCKRQVERWARQYIDSTGEGKSERNPKMLKLIAWLRQNIPSEDSAGSSAGLVHGDFRIDNLVFHPIEDRVIGILDWELSTLGNQMCDVAYNCLLYIGDISQDKVKHNEGFEITDAPEGVPSLEEYLMDYCTAAGRPWPVAGWKFYVAFSLFRGASILAGVHSRYIMGNASGGKRAQDAGEKANDLIQIAWSYIQRETVLSQNPPSDIRGKDHVYGIANEKKDQGLEEGGRFIPNKKVKELREKLIKFIEERIYPMEPEFSKLAQSSMRWTVHPEEEKLKEIAKQEGLWNLFIPFDSAARAREILFNGRDDNVIGTGFPNQLGAGLSNLEYGYLCEIMGRSVWAPQVFNCGAPDTGNMEVLLRYGNKEQLQEWLIPLLSGTIRSGFAMTEPQVASSDATNIECSIRREGDTYVINGKKWWTSGAMDPRCKLLILMGKTDLNVPIHKQQSMILIDINTPGVKILRPLTVFGFEDAPHGHAEISFENVRVPAKNILLGEGRGFEIAQGRLGPGRLHHCMRLIGAAERGMQLMVQRALQRRTFGKLIAQHGSFVSDVAKCRIELERTRLLVFEAADQLDKHGNKKARGALAMAKVATPNMALMVLDTAMQVHGAAGVSGDTVLSHLWATARTLRIADGPDEVHLGTIAKLELKRAKL